MHIIALDIKISNQVAFNEIYFLVVNNLDTIWLKVVGKKWLRKVKFVQRKAWHHLFADDLMVFLVNEMHF